jgi:hypothetical protein
MQTISLEITVLTKMQRVLAFSIPRADRDPWFMG